MQTMQNQTAPAEPEDDRHVSRSSSGAVQGAPIKAARAIWADDVQGAYESIALQLPAHSKCRLGWERLKNGLAGRGDKLIEVSSGSDSNLGVHLCPLLWWRGVQGAGWLVGRG